MLKIGSNSSHENGGIFFLGGGGTAQYNAYKENAGLAQRIAHWRHLANTFERLCTAASLRVDLPSVVATRPDPKLPWHSKTVFQNTFVRASLLQAGYTASGVRHMYKHR